MNVNKDVISAIRKVKNVDNYSIFFKEYTHPKVIGNTKRINKIIEKNDMYVFYEDEHKIFYINPNAIDYYIYGEPIVSFENDKFMFLVKGSSSYLITHDYDFNDKLERGIITKGYTETNLVYIDEL